MDKMDTCESLSIKVSFRGELRRFLVGKDLDYVNLEHKLQSLFGLAPKSFAIKYADEDNDLVTISSNEELMTAISTASNGVLRLTMVEKSSVAPATSAMSPVDPSFSYVAPPPSPPVMMFPSTAAAQPVGGPVYVPPMGYYPPPPVGHPPAGYAPVLYAYPMQPGSPSFEPTSTEPAWKKKWEKKVNHKHEKLAEKTSKREEKLHHKLEKLERKQEHGKPISPKKQDKVAHKFEKLSEKRDMKEGKLKAKAERLAHKEAKKAQKKSEEDLVARFVAHVTVAEGSVLPPSTPFTKTWRIRNDGTKPWPEFTRLLFLPKHGDQLGAPPVVSVAEGRPVLPGETVDVSVSMVSPPLAGSYISFWRLCAPSGKKFGQRVVVHLTVLAPAPSPFASFSSAPSFAVPMDVTTELARETGMEADQFVKKLNDLGLTIAKKD